jgi:signal transduction histidine kinase
MTKPSARGAVTFRSIHALFCSTGVTLWLRQQNTTMQPHLQFTSNPSARSARIVHELRNRLGAITGAVEVLNIAEPGGELAAEAQAIIVRQVRQLAQVLHELGVVPREHVRHDAGAEQIVVDTAASWLELPRVDLPGADGDDPTPAVLESQ